MILTNGSLSVTLPDDLDWVDEYDWSPVVQTAEYLLTGSLLVEAAVRQAGRPVTLRGAENRAWVTRADLDILQQLAALPGEEMTLTLLGRDPITVMFRHQDGAIEATPVDAPVPPAEDDVFYVTLKLMEV